MANTSRGYCEAKLHVLSQSSSLNRELAAPSKNRSLYSSTYLHSSSYIQLNKSPFLFHVDAGWLIRFDPFVISLCGATVYCGTVPVHSFTHHGVKNIIAIANRNRRHVTPSIVDKDIRKRIYLYIYIRLKLKVITSKTIALYNIIITIEIVA